MPHKRIKLARLITQEALITDTNEAIEAQMRRTGIRRATLARRLNVSRAQVTKMLDRRNLTLRSIADLAWAFGCDAEVTLSPIDNQASHD